MSRFSSLVPWLVALQFIAGCSLTQNPSPQSATPSTTTSSSTTTPSSTDFTTPTKPSEPDPSTPIEPNPTETPTTPEEETQRQSQDLLETAHRHAEQGQYVQAFQSAAESYAIAPSSQAYPVALYAATMMSPIELKRLEAQATSDFEQAVAGLVQIHIDAGLDDKNGVASRLPITLQALEKIGEFDEAQRLKDASERAQNDTRHTVAVFLPLSGNDRKIGRAMLGAMLLRAGIYDHTKLPFALRFFDTQSNTQNITAILDESQKRDFPLILGPLDIRECNATALQLDRAVMIGFSPNDDFLKNERVFQFSYALDREAEQIAQLLVSLGTRKIAIVGPDDAYTLAASRQLQENTPSSIEIENVNFPSTQTDLRDVAQKVAKLNPEVIYLPAAADVSERIASFMAQENYWCKPPQTPTPKAVNDNRKFVTCVAPSAWAPVAENHRYKFLVDALYLDYIQAATTLEPDFSQNFQLLYHRLPAVHEIMPWLALSLLKDLPESTWESPQTLQHEVFLRLQGQRYLMVPSFRQITTTSSKPYLFHHDLAASSDRQLITQ